MTHDLIEWEELMPSHEQSPQLLYRDAVNNAATAIVAAMLAGRAAFILDCDFMFVLIFDFMVSLLFQL